MPYRRAAGFTAVLLMTQLLLAGSELACPRHDNESVSSADVSTAAESSGAHQHADHNAEPASQPVEHHSLPDCCPAMNACSGSMALRSADHLLTAGVPSLSAPTYVATLFHSRVESPDPPPPKA